eukprot:6100816-Pyramimonas_sp.AAC.1
MPHKDAAVRLPIALRRGAVREPTTCRVPKKALSGDSLLLASEAMTWAAPGQGGATDWWPPSSKTWC